MFSNLIKRTKTYIDLLSKYDDLKNELADVIRQHTTTEKVCLELKEENERLSSSGPQVIKEGSSSITFEIDNDLKVTLRSRINKEIFDTLIDENYLTSEQTEDEGAVQLSFILIANEVTEQLIYRINEDELGVDQDDD